MQTLSLPYLSGAFFLSLAAASCGGADDPPGGSSSSTSSASASSSSGSGGSGGSGGAGASGWETLASLPAGPRQETAVVAQGGKVYVLGGFDEKGEVVTDVIAYDPDADAWATATPLPKSLHHINAAVVGETIYVAGALQGINFAATGAVYAFDPALMTWTEKTSMPAGTERGSSAVGVIGSKIYLAGGYRGGSVADFSAYDTEADTWEALPALPEPRDHLVGGVASGVFYAIGGRNGGIDKISGDVLAFDPSAGAWSPRAPMLTPRGGAAAGVLADRFYVVGGEGNAASPVGVFAENEVYDPVNDAWSALEPMKSPRHGTGAVGLNGKLYVPGGADKQAFAAVDTNEAFTP
jgi:N-acetylneuraminic acid mutarotase